MDHTRWYSPTSCLGLLGQWKHGTAKAQVSGHEGVASALSRKLVCPCRQLLKGICYGTPKLLWTIDPMSYYLLGGNSFKFSLILYILN